MDHHRLEIRTKEVECEMPQLPGQPSSCVLSQQGYRINKLAMSLTDPANRQRLCADEQAYVAQYGLSTDEIDLVARRNWAGLIERGGNVYVLLKIAATVGQNLLLMGAQMRDETLDEFLKTRPAHGGHPIGGRWEHGTHRRRHQMTLAKYHRASPYLHSAHQEELVCELNANG
jgi:protocatechuate 4,5-dioxygenase alpha subunit